MEIAHIGKYLLFIYLYLKFIGYPAPVLKLFREVKITNNLN